MIESRRSRYSRQKQKLHCIRGAISWADLHQRDFVRCAIPIGETECPARTGRTGHILGGSVAAAAAAGARPDQRVGLATLVLDQVGVDGAREARGVELDREGWA